MPDHDVTSSASTSGGESGPSGGERPDRDAAGISAWGRLLDAARITATEQDLDLRYTAVLDQGGVGPVPVECLGRIESEVNPGELGERLAAIKRGAIESGEPRQGRVDVERAGHSRTFEVTATPRRDEQGRIVGVLSVAVDLTDAVRARHQQRISQARLAGILGSAMDAIVSAGPDRRILYFNPAAERMFGVAAEDVVGTPIDRFVPVTLGTASDPGAARTGAREQAQAVRASGESFPVEASISSVGSGGEALFTLVVRDRTDLERLQARHLQTQTLDGIARLAGGVAHDFNNLLTVILGYCDLMRTRQRGGTELDEISNAARRASHVTRQLLAFSRRQVLQVETIDLNALVRSLSRMLRRIVGEDIVLEVDLADEFLWVVADVGQIEQVLLNLVMNARDAMPTGGTVRITTRVTERLLRQDGTTRKPHAELVVEDDGAGMTEDVRDRVFEPFFTTKGEAGTGLGLATVHGIVTQSGGDITCESRPGHGSTFHVWLPSTEAPPADARADGARHAGARGHETVLVIEDETLVRDLASRALREYGYRVLEAQDVECGLRLVGDPALALIVADVAPGSAGPDLSAEIEGRRPGLPVLYMTGYSEALMARSIDPAHLLRKPFTPADLVAKIRFLLDRPGR